MHIETSRFGDFEFPDNKVISFPSGLPGFEDLQRFVILEIEKSKPLYWLQSTDNKYIALPAMIPFELMDNHSLQVRDSDLEELHVEEQSDLIVMNVVVIPEDIRQMTVNLAAPIIINAKEGIGKQILIDAKELPIRYPIYDAVMRAAKGGKENAGAV